MEELDSVFELDYSPMPAEEVRQLMHDESVREAADSLGVEVWTVAHWRHAGASGTVAIALRLLYLDGVALSGKTCRGQDLAVLLDTMEMTHAELAHEIGRTAPTIGEWLRLDRLPNGACQGSIVRWMCSTCGIEVGDLPAVEKGYDLQLDPRPVAAAVVRHHTDDFTRVEAAKMVGVAEWSISKWRKSGVTGVGAVVFRLVFEQCVTLPTGTCTGEHLGALLEVTGMTQHQFAQSIGCTAPTISKWRWSDYLPNGRSQGSLVKWLCRRAGIQVTDYCEHCGQQIKTNPAE